jgi:hypothetical protein
MLSMRHLLHTDLKAAWQRTLLSGMFECVCTLHEARDSRRAVTIWVVTPSMFRSAACGEVTTFLTAGHETTQDYHPSGSGCEYLFITTEGRSRMKQKTLGRERLRSSLQFAARSWTPACSLLPRREMCTPCAPVTLPLRLRLRSCVLPAALVIAEVKKLCKVQVFCLRMCRFL